MTQAAPKLAIRPLAAGDIDAVARFEAEIAERSFGNEAVTDLDHYRKKLGKLVKYGDDWTRVMTRGDALCGWAWVSGRRNFITDDLYADFRSFYVDGPAAGPAGAVTLFRAVLAHCREAGFTRIVGRTASTNRAMRSLYELAGFAERHIVYELDVGSGRPVG
jgi:GNAT superfamily N-acetyltransferase